MQLDTHTHRVLSRPNLFVCVLTQTSPQLTSSLTFRVTHTPGAAQLFLQHEGNLDDKEKSHSGKEGQDSTLEYLANPLCFRREMEDLATE